MAKSVRMIFLYCGLGLLALSLILKPFVPSAVFTIMLVAAISLKVMFLAFTFRVKGFNFSRGLKLILAGVVTILVSMLIKNREVERWIYYTLFYGAISMKVLGLAFLIKDKDNG